MVFLISNVQSRHISSRKNPNLEAGFQKLHNQSLLFILKTEGSSFSSQDIWTVLFKITLIVTPAQYSADKNVSVYLIYNSIFRRKKKSKKFTIKISQF